MISTGGRRRAFIPLLAAAVLVQGFIGLVPHDHEAETVLTVPELQQQAPAPEPVSVLPVARRVAESRCLACVITPLAFAQPDGTPSLASGATSTPAVVESVTVAALPRLWRCPLRGPPARV
jgi:hypothetical protein